MWIKSFLALAVKFFFSPPRIMLLTTAHIGSYVEVIADGMKMFLIIPVNVHESKSNLKTHSKRMNPSCGYNMHPPFSK